MMIADKIGRVSIQDEADVYAAAQRAKRLARELHFDRVSWSRLEMVTLELARNALVHGGGGEMLLRRVRDKGRVGLEIQVMDNGPGIVDLERAMVDGYSTAGRLGAGLGAAQRLSDEFEIDSQPGGGTRILTRSWRTEMKGLD
jgi:serine/threonine-protein kinase RsbT